MRKIIVSMNVTLDGFMAGLNGELDWHFPLWTEEMSIYICHQLGKMDTILLGRRSYEHMAGYWPVKTFTGVAQEYAEMMNSHTKIVFSETLNNTTWQNSRLLKGNISEQVADMKQLPGKDMIIYGSGSIVQSFVRQGLIDELQIWVHPVFIQQGVPMFRKMEEHIALQFVRTRTFRSGVVLLYYKIMNDEGTV
ncbi:dihydrofolate reductase family protein [Chitinophaga rhizophila]|uniref:Dihydrofolate reductase family protein n=1 Tax=Chitinophaga rhizophila TaxID=2866212 RepID=A0ABS7G7I8_9BACT|nr:dihydrofolate reductase family protein [Chitinophaga rhizophila]MBW8683605.1 dihydrofolate reductase family protein [Chitinophaga rhizophila]